MFPPDEPAGSGPSTETPPAPEPSNPTNPTPPTEPPAPTPPSQPAAGKGENERVRAAVAEKNAAEKRAADAEKALREREEADMSELQKAQARAERAEKDKAESDARALRLERSGVARSAASEKGFIDTEDAIALLDLEALDTDAKIKTAVEKLAEAKPHLVRRTPAQGFGNAGGTGLPATTAEGVPLDEEGKPDEKLGLGRDLLQHLRR